MKPKLDPKEREKVVIQLRELLPPGATVYIVLRHVSRSGMSRGIDVYAITDNDPFWLSGRVAPITGFSFSDKWECLRVDGCGMDMGFHVVYNLSSTLYPAGFECIGDKCPSNDHSNGDRDYTPGPNHWHRDGGYALRHRWI